MFDSLLNVLYLLLFFFFQAEDGIRDRDVTGVQTCALPSRDNSAILIFNIITIKRNKTATAPT